MELEAEIRASNEGNDQVKYELVFYLHSLPARVKVDL